MKIMIQFSLKAWMVLAILIVLLFFVTDARPAVDNPSNEFKSCHGTKAKKEHSGNLKPLRRKRLVNTNVTKELDRCHFHTTENSICLPDFEEWQNVHAAWHGPDDGLDTALLGQSIVRYLDKHSHSRERCDQSPTTCNWCRINKDVENYAERLMDEVGKLCPLFTTNQLIHTGSSADKTNIFQASEFDHLAMLENFSQSPSDPNEIVYTGSDPSVALKYGSRPVNASELLNLFWKCILETVEVVHSDYLSSPKILIARTGVTIYFIYAGKSETMRISLDIAIGVQIAQQPPQIWYVEVKKEDVVLVPQHPGVGNQWRLSYPTLERDMLLRADASIVRVHQLLKFLAALHHSKNNRKRLIPRKSSLTTHVLKTCLFNYMRQCYWPEEAPWLAENAVQHAVGILGYFPFNDTVMTSFFNKDMVECNITLESKQAATEIMARLSRMK